MTGAIAVLNRKGGVGKTTTAIAFGEVSARTGTPATVVDLDPQGGAVTWSDFAKEAGDSMAATVLQPPADVTAVQLPRWVTANLSGLVMFDCPPGDAPAQDAAVEVAAASGGLVVIPTTPKPTDVTATALALNFVGDRARTVVLMTMVATGTIRAREARAELTAFGAEVLEAEIPNREEISRDGLAVIRADGLLLNFYAPVLDEIRELKP